MSIDNFSREIEVGQNSVNKSDNFSCEIEVCQNNANKSDNFSRQIEVCQSNENKSDKNFFNFYKSLEFLLYLHFTT